MKRSMLWLVALVCLFLTSTVLSRPELVTTLDRVDLPGQSITLGGKTYRLADDVRWFGLGDRKPADVIPLITGRRMGIEIDYSTDQPVVTEVWIQP